MKALIFDFDGLILDTETADYQSWLEIFQAIEDSPNGIQSAKAAGLYCVAVPNPITRLLNFSQADWVLPSLSDLRLRDLLKRVDPSG